MQNENYYTADTIKQSPKWFTWPASMVIVGAIGWIAYFLGHEVKEGHFPWWPYPSFAVLVVVIFTLDWLISRRTESCNCGDNCTCSVCRCG